MSKGIAQLNLVQYLLKHSYYSKKLNIQATLLLEIIHYNYQLHHVLEKILANSDFANTSQLDLKKFHDEFFMMECFFEYLFYANESFIRTSAYGDSKTI